MGKLLSEHIADCQAILAEHGDLETVTAIDDEGNGYNPVNFTPSVGAYIDEDGGSFITEGEFEWWNEEYGDDGDDELKVNAVCIN